MLLWINKQKFLLLHNLEESLPRNVEADIRAKQAPTSSCWCPWFRDGYNRVGMVHIGWIHNRVGMVHILLAIPWFWLFIHLLNWNDSWLVCKTSGESRSMSGSMSWLIHKQLIDRLTEFDAPEHAHVRCPWTWKVQKSFYWPPQHINSILKWSA